jgi:hypothetical protein
VDTLTERTMSIAQQVRLRHRLPLDISERRTTLAGLRLESLQGENLCKTLFANMNGPVYRFLDFEVGVDYSAQGPVIRDAVPTTVRLHIRNTYKVQANLGLHWYVPEGWKVSPSADGALLALPAHMGEPLEATFTLEAPAVRAPMNRAAVELTVAGRPTVMLVPITLMNGNLM